MDAKEKVLATMKEAGQPLNAGKIAELSGLDRKEVDAAMKQLKALSGPPIIEENGIACIALIATFAGVLLTSAILIIIFFVLLRLLFFEALAIPAMCHTDASL